MFKVLFGRVHVSWYIAVVSAGILTGCAISYFVSPGLFAGYQWLVLSLSLFAVALVKRQLVLCLLVLGSGVLLGLWAGSTELRDLSYYQAYYEQTVTVKGKVADDVTRADNGDLRIQLGNVAVNGHDLSGEVWAHSADNVDIKRGDIVTLRGSLNDGFGVFAGSMHRAATTTAERPSPGDVARKARDRLTLGIQEAIPAPESDLGASYLIGQRRLLPEELGGQLRMLGLVHLVVASGFHLTVVISFARQVFARLSKYMALLSSLAMMLSFLLVTGFSTSMTRASMVAGATIVAWYYGRNIHPVILLLSVAAITALIKPSFMWGDIAWYLSFSAFAGVIILAPLLDEYFFKPTESSGFIKQIALATISAQITTFPVVALVIGQYSPLSLVSNLMIAPLVPIAMALTLIAGIAGLILAPVASIVGLPAYAILYFMTNAARYLSATPWAYGEIGFDSMLLISSYLVIAAFCVFLWRKTGYSFRRQRDVGNSVF